MITEALNTLKIHKLTQEQYDNALATGNIDENAVYLTPEGDISVAVDEDGNAWVGYSDEVAKLPDILPEYTASDEGKFLSIVNGVPTWVSVE